MRKKTALLLIAALLLLLPGGALAGTGATGLKVVILPFEMHSGVSISGVRRSVMEALASGMRDQGAEVVGVEAIRQMVSAGTSTGFDEKTALDVSAKTPADFALLGSITRIGSTYNMDIRAFSIRTRENVAFYSKTATSVAGLVSTVRSKSPEIYKKLLTTLQKMPVEKQGVISAIEVSGNRRVDDLAVLKKLTSKVGEPFSVDNVTKDIKTLYGTGYFEDISVDLTDTASGKVMTFYVKETPFVKSVEIKGAKEVEESKIREVITIKENVLLDRSALGDNVKRVRQLYGEEGFFLAEVSVATKADGLDAVVTFTIKEGPPVRVKRITILGNSFFSARKIRRIMETKESWLFAFLTQSGRFDELTFQNDLAQIIGKYYDNGFINADILDHKVFLSEDKRWFYITIYIKEGEQYRFGHLDVTGEIIGLKKDLLKKFAIKEGDIFSRTTLTRDIEGLKDFYGDKGYAYVDVKPHTNVHADEKTVDLTFDIKKNDLVHIDKINITGNTRTRDKVIRRELYIDEKDLYSSTGIKKSKNALRRLGYFDDVAIEKVRGKSSDKIDIDVKVKERPTGAISAGIGYSSVDNLIGTASISQSNLFGTGLKLDLSGTISSSSTRFVLSFTEPYLLDKPISAGIDLYNTDQEFQGFNTRKKGFDTRLGFPFFGRENRAYVTYTLEDAEVLDVATTASTFIKEQEGSRTESSVSLTLTRDTRDDAFFPRHGAVITYSAKVAGGVLGGSVYTIKHQINAIQYFPLPYKTTFSVRGQAGYLRGYGGHDEPIYERFFLGGINTIRGFDTRTISPKDPLTGDLIGGNTMFVTNLEFLFPLVKGQKIRGLLFFDAGNSYDGNVDFSDIRTAAGTGIRWYSPVGPLRLELGINLSPREGEPSTNWDFTIGSTF